MQYNLNDERYFNKDIPMMPDKYIPFFNEINKHNKEIYIIPVLMIIIGFIALFCSMDILGITSVALGFGLCIYFSVEKEKRRNKVFFKYFDFRG